MYKLIPVLFLLLSCKISGEYLIKYQIIGEAETAKIEYINNGISVSEEILIPYTKEIFLNKNREVGIHIYNIVGGVAECRVFFIHNSGWQTYETQESNHEIIIKGKISSIL